MVRKWRICYIERQTGDKSWELISDGKNSTVLRFKGKKAITKLFKVRKHFLKEIKGYDTLSPFYNKHFPKRSSIDPKSMHITYEDINLPRLKDLILQCNNNKLEVGLLRSYSKVLEQLFQIVLSTRQAKTPIPSGKYFFDAWWHINRLRETNYSFQVRGLEIETDALFDSSLVVNEKVFPPLSKCLEEAKETYQKFLPRFSVVLHSDENHKNFLVGLGQDSRWYLVDPQWFVRRGDWIVLLAELYNGWRRFLYQPSSTYSASKKGGVVILKYDLVGENWNILRQMDNALFSIAKKIAEGVKDPHWFRRFIAYYLYKSVRGGVWGRLQREDILPAAIGEALRVYSSDNPNNILGGV